MAWLRHIHTLDNALQFDSRKHHLQLVWWTWSGTRRFVVVMVPRIVGSGSISIMFNLVSFSTALIRSHWLSSDQSKRLLSYHRRRGWILWESSSFLSSSWWLSAFANVSVIFQSTGEFEQSKRLIQEDRMSVSLRPSPGGISKLPGASESTEHDYADGDDSGSDYADGDDGRYPISRSRSL